LKAGVGSGKVEGWLKLEICSAGVGHPITSEVSSVSPLGVQNLKRSLLLPFWISPLLLKRISEPQFKLHKLQRYSNPKTPLESSSYCKQRSHYNAAYRVFMSLLTTRKS
jgi:hypothetical protein